MTWTYPVNISRAQECSEATALVKVARHSPCLHGWELLRNPDSPYDAAVDVSMPGTISCQCEGAVPPTSLPIQAGEQATRSAQDLMRIWPACGRCSHALDLHGLLDVEPTEERQRRIKVAVRMDELLEDQDKLLDFSYTDEDLCSLKRYVPFMVDTDKYILCRTTKSLGPEGQ